MSSLSLASELPRDDTSSIQMLQPINPQVLSTARILDSGRKLKRNPKSRQSVVRNVFSHVIDSFRRPVDAVIGASATQRVKDQSLYDTVNSLLSNTYSGGVELTPKSILKKDVYPIPSAVKKSVSFNLLGDEDERMDPNISVVDLEAINLSLRIRYLCPYCMLGSWTTVKRVTDHICDYHRIYGRTYFFCGHCGLGFDREVDRDLHLISLHLQTKMNWKQNPKNPLTHSSTSNEIESIRSFISPQPCETSCVQTLSN